MFAIWKIILTIIATGMMLAGMLVINRWLAIDANPLWLVGIVGVILTAVLAVTHGQAFIGRVISKTGEIHIATRPTGTPESYLPANPFEISGRKTAPAELEVSSSDGTSIARSGVGSKTDGPAPARLRKQKGKAALG
jgi:hypothetical protein